MNVFQTPPQGIQTAPHDPRILAAGHQVTLIDAAPQPGGSEVSSDPPRSPCVRR